MNPNKKGNSRKKWLVRLLWALAAILVAYGGGRIAAQALYPRKYNDLVLKYSQAYGVDPSVLFALIKCESGFDPQATSPVDARGLTQITPETFHWLQSKTREQLEDSALYTPEVSVKYGALLLSMHLKEFGGVREAFAAYHAGRGAVGGWLKEARYSPDGKTLSRIPYGNTKNYVTAVDRTIRIYRILYRF